MFRNYKVRNYNLILVLAVVGLTILGILVIGSADHDNQNKQIIGMALGLAVMLAVSLVDYDFVLQFYWLIYGAVLVLLVLTIPTAPSDGSSSASVSSPRSLGRCFWCCSSPGF